MFGRNDETNGMIVGIALLVTLAYLIFLVVAVVVGFLALVMTVIAAVAYLKGGLTLGDAHITPEEARTFFLRGALCAVVAPIFWAFACAVLGSTNTLPWEWLFLGGYAFGSAGLSILEAMEDAEKIAQEPELPLLEVVPDIAQNIPVTPRPEPFRFASWDDEDRV